MKTLIDYLQEFKAVAKEWFANRGFVDEHYRFFQEFFKKENLAKYEWSDIQKLGDHIHSFNSMAIAKKNALGKPNHAIGHYRKSFTYLAHGEDPVEERIQKFTSDSVYQLKYFGEAAVSEIVGYLFSDKFVLYNDRDKFALDLLSIHPAFSRGDDFSTRLQKFNNAICSVVEAYQKIVGKQTSCPLNLEVDQFFSYLYEKYHSKDDELDPPTDVVNYWTISPGEGARLWDLWQQDGIIAIGWDDLGNLNQYQDKSEIRTRLQQLSSESTSSQKNNVTACYNFVKVMKQGDVVFAKKGRKVILGYGVIKSDYIFDDKRVEYKHIRMAEWHKTGNWSLPEHEQVALKTLTCITMYEDFVNSLKQIVGMVDSTPRYWWLNANPKIWKFDETPVGEKQTYTSHNEKGNKRQKYMYFQEVKSDDIVVGYVTSPQREIVALCKITKGLHKTKDEGEVIEFEKIEQLAKPIPYEILQDNPDLSNCEPMINNQGSLFKLTEKEYEIIRSLIDETNIPTKTEIVTYTKKKAMVGLFLSEFQFDEMLDALKEKKNVILQGAPGVGKTFIAKRIAYTIIGSNDPQRVEMIQFHQSYSYEDFIQGFRPTPKGHFDLKNGIFYQFCRRAQREESSQKPYIFIIDEINRGNLSKIFGELMMLIEPDKRGKEFAIPLAYSQSYDEKFYIPENLFLIGMLNTADRSLAMVDYALRRRFRFITLHPEFNSRAFQEFLSDAGAKPELVNKIVIRMNVLNEVIASDSKNLGSGYQIGHSYFCPRNDIKPDDEWYRRVIDSEIMPLIQEYWFDNEQKVKEQRSALLV